MNILLLGATGRVGTAVTDIILGNGHQLTILVRGKNKVKSQSKNLEIVEGDVYDWALLKQLSARNFDVIVNAINTNPLNHSTLLNDAAVAVTSLFSFTGAPVRYIALTGIAQMEKTLLGRATLILSKLIPFHRGISDQQEALEIVKSSDIDWCLIACPQLIDGPRQGKFKTTSIFDGGVKKIHPDDVAIVIYNQLSSNSSKKIIGVWY